MKNKSIEKQPEEGRGLFAGYKPNRLSVYLLMISAGRADELYDVIMTDMEKYKIKDENEKPKGKYVSQNEINMLLEKSYEIEDYANDLLEMVNDLKQYTKEMNQ